MWSPETLLMLAAIFLLAGGVKGVVGLGLPTVSLALMTLSFGLPTAMALLLLPSLVTNLWQAFAGAHLFAVLKRIWPLLLLATLLIPLGGLLLRGDDLTLLTALLGVSLVLYGGLGLMQARLTLSRRQEAWAGPLVGAANGVLTGMTGSFVVPGVLYLQSIGLQRDALIQAMGLLFTLSTLGLGVSLGGLDLLSEDLMLLSAFAVVPALAGMRLGQALRQRISEVLFRRLLFVSLLILGVGLMLGR
ncbi:MAG: TSUP family transporter [Kiloniellales bacterium]